MTEDDFAGQEFNAEETVEEPEPEPEPEEEIEDDFQEESEDEVVEDDSTEQEEETVEESESEGSDQEDQDFDKPVNEGDIVEVEIDDLGSKGDGIARVEGFVVFVPGAEVGETYDVEVTSVGNKFAFAEITE